MSEPWDPPPPPSGPYGPRPGNNLILAIIATVVSIVFCCVPHGVISLIFALQVDKKVAVGDIEGAVSAANQAKTWAIISIIVSVIWLVISIAFGFLNFLLSEMR